MVAFKFFVLNFPNNLQSINSPFSNLTLYQLPVWLDTGTHDSLLEASNFIHTIEKHSGLKVACLEEIAFKMGYINSEQLKKLILPLKKTGYGEYLKNKVL